MNIIDRAIKKHGAAAVYAAANARMSGDHNALLGVGLNAESLADADEIGRAAYRAMPKADQAADYWDAQKTPHAMTGKQNAIKADEPASSVLTVRVTPHDKAHWVKTAQHQGLKLSEWVIQTLNGAS